MPMRLVTDRDEDDDGDTFLVALKVVAGSSRDRIVGGWGESIKVTVSKPADRGAANRAVVKLFADFLDLPESAVTIVGGHTSPFKTLRVTGTTTIELSRRLKANADKQE